MHVATVHGMHLYSISHQERMSHRRRRRSIELSMHSLVKVVVLHTSVPKFTLYGKRPLCKSVENKLGVCAAVQLNVDIVIVILTGFGRWQ